MVKLGAEKQRGRRGLFVDAVRRLKRQGINGTEEGKELLRRRSRALISAGGRRCRGGLTARAHLSASDRGKRGYHFGMACWAMGRFWLLLEWIPVAFSTPSDH
jgi:hypothetical protein